MFKKLEIENKILIVLLLMVLAYLFSYGVRLYWPIMMADNSAMMWNNELMINTNDGYYFATAIQDYISGISRNSLGTTTALELTPAFVYVAVFLQKVLPLSFETLILYMPAMIASLVVIPIILAFRLINHTFLGFLAALIGSIGWSYYNRTMVGYFDSDMFAVFLLFFVSYSFLRIAFKKDIFSVIFSALLVSIYPFFYPQGLSLIYAMFFILIFYLFLEYKKIISTTETVDLEANNNILLYALVVLSIAVIFAFSFLMKLALFTIATILFLKVKLEQRYWVYLALGTFLLFLFYGNVFSILSAKLMTYVNRGVEEEGLRFFQVIQTVREAGKIPLETIANRISGSGIGLILSLVGYGILVFRHKPFIILLPLIGIGLFAYVGGLRFTVYAVPVAALSVVYLFWVIGSYFKEKKFQYLFVVAGTIGMLYPNIKHIQAYLVPVVFNKQEVQVLEKLKSISTIDDYTLAWWDYGYPIWYYSNTNTLIDGGKHHNDNFIISEILSTDSQLEAARFSRIAVEKYAENDFVGTAVDALFNNGQENEVNPNEYLENLRIGDVTLPKKTRDIFLYLPNRMLNIFPTVGLFSNIDLKTGQKGQQPFFYKADRFEDNAKQLNLGSGIVLDKSTSILHIGQQQTPLKQFVMVAYDNKGKLNKKVQTINPNAEISLIFMQSYNSFLVLDESMFNSVFIQLFVLDNYDKELFELVINNPLAKVYKLKK